MRSFTGFAVVAALSLALSPAAGAQTDDRTADEIRQALKRWIGVTAMGLGAEIAIELDGPIAVTPTGDRYAVVLPPGRADFRGEGVLYFDPVEIDLTPTGNGWYQAAWQVPDRYRFEPEHGADVLITVASQSGSGLFAPEFATMMSMDAALGGLEIRDSAEPSGLRVDQIIATMRSTEVSAGIYDTTQRFAATGIAGYQDGRDFVTVDSIVLDAVGDDVRVAEYAAFNARLREMAAGSDGQFESISELMKTVSMPYAGFEGLVTIGGVAATDGTERFSMAEWTTRIALDSPDGGPARFALELAGAGVEFTADGLTRLVPTESRLRLALVDVPNEELAQVFGEVLAGADQVDPGLAMMMAAGDIQQALSVAGTTLEIGPIRLASPIASIDLEGALRPEISSPYSVAGEIDMVTTGLDALIAELQRTGGDQNAIQMLTLLQTLGAQAPEADGRSVRTYAFRLDPAGTLLLNGSDIMPLITGSR